MFEYNSFAHKHMNINFKYVCRNIPGKNDRQLFVEQYEDTVNTLLTVNQNNINYLQNLLRDLDNNWEKMAVKLVLDVVLSEERKSGWYGH